MKPAISLMLASVSPFVSELSIHTPPSGYRAGLRAVAPLLPAVLAFGVSFGVLADAAGMGGTASIVMSLTTFAGSAQFAAVSVLGAGGTVAAAIAAAVLLNARYGPMALSAAGAFRGGRLRRLLEAQLLVDESWALSQREGRFDRRVMLGAGTGPLRRLERRNRASAWWWATRSRTRPRSASTPRSQPCSSRCWRRSSEAARRWRRRCWARASRCC